MVDSSCCALYNPPGKSSPGIGSWGTSCSTPACVCFIYAHQNYCNNFLTSLCLSNFVLLSSLLKHPECSMVILLHDSQIKSFLCSKHCKGFFILLSTKVKSYKHDTTDPYTLPFPTPSPSPQVLTSLNSRILFSQLLSCFSHTGKLTAPRRWLKTSTVSMMPILTTYLKVHTVPTLHLRRTPNPSMFLQFFFSSIEFIIF